MDCFWKRNEIFYFVFQSDGEDFNYIIAFFLGTAACLYQVSLLPFLGHIFPWLIVSRIKSVIAYVLKINKNDV